MNFKKDKRAQGERFERQAESFLITKGYRLIKRNYYYNSREIDLIMLSPEQILTFIEVKYRSHHYQNDFNPWESVPLKKQEYLFSAAQGFINENPNFQDFYSRYDVIIIRSSPQNQSVIHHLPNAFRQGGTHYS